MTRAIAGWRLSQGERRRLLARFPAHYPDVVADHVTLRFGTGEATPLPVARKGEIVGEADDGVASCRGCPTRSGGISQKEQDDDTRE